jgi:hypothetical protein
VKQAIVSLQWWVLARKEKLLGRLTHLLGDVHLLSEPLNLSLVVVPLAANRLRHSQQVVVFGLRHLGEEPHEGLRQQHEHQRHHGD